MLESLAIKKDEIHVSWISSFSWIRKHNLLMSVNGTVRVFIIEQMTRTF